MITRPVVEDFQERLHQTFRMAAAGGPALDVELIEVRDLGRRRLADGGELSCFALTFRAAAGTAWPQATYRLAHDTLGALDVFLVPVGPDGSGMRYEAVFN